MSGRSVFERMWSGFRAALEGGAMMNPMAARFVRPTGAIAMYDVVEAVPLSSEVLPVEERLQQIVHDEAARLGAGMDAAPQTFDRVFNDMGPPPGTDPQPPTIPDMHS